MTTFQINRLVRDRMVPQLLRKCKVSYKKLTGDVLIEALKEKLYQTLEMADQGDKDEKPLEHIADAREIVESLILHDANPIELLPEQNRITQISNDCAIQLKKVLDMQTSKKRSRGVFNEGYYIEDITVSKDVPEVYDLLVQGKYPIKK